MYMQSMCHLLLGSSPAPAFCVSIYSFFHILRKTGQNQLVFVRNALTDIGYSSDPRPQLIDYLDCSATTGFLTIYVLCITDRYVSFSKASRSPCAPRTVRAVYESPIQTLKSAVNTDTPSQNTHRLHTRSFITLHAPPLQ